MTFDDALSELQAAIEPGRSAQMADYHKIDRPYLGVSNPDLNEITKAWRSTLDVDNRVRLASELWNSDIFEARLAAAKLLTQARMRPDAGAWDLIQTWVPQFDSWAIADHACMAGQRRLLADPSRIDTVEAWTSSEHMWTRRAALVITLPWTKQNHPTELDSAIRDRVLGWAATYVTDKEWFIQKAVAWWVRDLSKHDLPRAQAFMDGPGQGLKAIARKEAAKHWA